MLLWDFAIIRALQLSFNISVIVFINSPQEEKYVILWKFQTTTEADEILNELND